ncbi:MAG: aldo/keto reductase [Paludisphaera borealis]|uniref:aldo/keto reductase n=1 Tax=Paludisphaera borealis TaxID=1387353 RepID=UPI00284A3CBF|nr:aldo/keto reductase [Paludisphaera borealis]MDR3617808.1 aldo/keto reductase [Paludisphaera borealis]
MKTRKIGGSGLEVAPLAFGGNVFGWTIDEARSFKLLDAFVAAGFNLVDTADMYSRWAPGNHGGESETIIGKWFKQTGKRDKVVLATKVGMEMGPDKKGLSKPYIFKAVEDSLKRLQTDRIDLYQSHKDDPDTPVEETLEAFGELIKQGKVRAIGASNYSAARLAESLKFSKAEGLPAYQCLQPQYNLMERAGYEHDLEPLCDRENIGVIPYYSLASGFLSGKYRTEDDLKKSARGQGVKKYLDARGFRVLDALEAVAAETASNPARVAIAWLIARPSVTAPIASATSIEQLDDLIEATRLELDDAAIKRLNEASA